jgi:hypothetical protein
MLAEITVGDSKQVRLVDWHRGIITIIVRWTRNQWYISRHDETMKNFVYRSVRLAYDPKCLHDFTLDSKTSNNVLVADSLPPLDH